jgi:hypothetical protein
LETVESQTEVPLGPTMTIYRGNVRNSLCTGCESNSSRNLNLQISGRKISLEYEDHRVAFEFGHLIFGQIHI